MNYNEALNYIHSLLVFGSRPGLDRIAALLKALDNPQDDLKFIHVAGTNGKGSVCTMLSNIYMKAGLKTGLYTSPFVVDFRERIQVNGKYIKKEILASLTEKVKATGIIVTEFEFITALAMLYFKLKKCDIVILETGLGGRFDATNVIKTNLASVITRIDFDHTDYLGDTLSKIAMEKSGIIKKGSPTVCYPLQETEAKETIKSYSEKFITPNIENLQIINDEDFGNRFIYKNKEYKTSLCGEHQIYNALTVIETVKAVGIKISDEIVAQGIYDASIPARLEIISKKPLVVLDGAHNLNGGMALKGFLGKHKNAVAIIGMMADKDCDSFLKVTLPFVKKVITVTVKENKRTMSAKELADLAEKYCRDVQVAESYKQAIELAAKEESTPIFVFGSLYLAGGLRDDLISFFK